MTPLERIIKVLQPLEQEISNLRDKPAYDTEELNNLHRAISEFLSSQPNGGD